MKELREEKAISSNFLLNILLKFIITYPFQIDSTLIYESWLILKNLKQSIYFLEMIRYTFVHLIVLQAKGRELYNKTMQIVFQ